MKHSELKQLIKEEIRKVLNEDSKLDLVLDKISDQGIDSLTPEEKEYLDSISSGKTPAKKISNTISNSEFLIFLNNHKNEIFDKIYAKNGYSSEDVATLKKWYKFDKVTSQENTPWFGEVPIPEIGQMKYNDPRRVSPDASEDRSQISIAQTEYDFISDFIGAEQEGYLDYDEQPEIFPINIGGKTIYYITMGW